MRPAARSVKLGVAAAFGRVPREVIEDSVRWRHEMDRLMTLNAWFLAIAFVLAFVLILLSGLG